MPNVEPDVIAAGVIGAGAYLRWAVAPVIAAYEIGKQVGRATPRKVPPLLRRRGTATLALVPLAFAAAHCVPVQERAYIYARSGHTVLQLSGKKEEARDNEWQADAGRGSIYQRGRSGQWVAVADLGWSHGKRDRREFTGATAAEARGKREAFMDRRRDGFTMPKGRQPYVSEWLLHWLHNVARREVEPTTWEGSYRQKVTELICPYFERVPLPELTEEDIEAWHAQLEVRTSKRTGRPLSASTIGQCHRIFSRAIKVAVARGRLPRNPLQNVSPPRADAVEIEPPSADEVRLIIERCKTWPTGARWILAISSGLRQGEVLGLEWPQVKLSDPASVSVVRSAARVGGERVVKAPKSDAGRRTVPLPDVAVEALKRHRAANPVRGLRRDVVFRGVAGKPLHPRVDYTDWCALLDDLGLQHFRVHDIRHGYATMLLEAGIDPRVVMDMLGWSSSAMLKRYEHVRPVLHAQAAAAVSRALSGE